MSSSASPTVVIVPGLRDHVDDHWQTLLAAGLDRVRTVPPLEHDRLSLDARVAALDDVLTGIDGPVVMVAHSAGVMIAVHWASRHDPAGFLYAAARRLSDAARPRRQRLEPGPAQPVAVPEHRRREPQRSARRVHGRRRSGARVGQPARRSR